MSKKIIINCVLLDFSTSLKVSTSKLNAIINEYDDLREITRQCVTRIVLIRGIRLHEKVR